MKGIINKIKEFILFSRLDKDVKSIYRKNKISGFDLYNKYQVEPNLYLTGKKILIEQNKMVKSLKRSGAWDKLDSLYFPNTDFPIIKS
jgi:hypothetical protein